MSNVSNAVFWIDQEPVEGSEDVFLPADTPIHNPSSKVLYQQEAKRQKREARALVRANDYYYSRLIELRKCTANELKTKFDSETPSAQLVIIEDNSKFFDNSSGELQDLLSYISKVKSKEITEFPKNMDSFNDSLYDTPPVKHNEEIDILYKAKQQKVLEEYMKIRHELQSNSSNTSLAYNTSPSFNASPVHNTTELPQSATTRPIPRDPRLQ